MSTMAQLARISLHIRVDQRPELRQRFKVMAAQAAMPAHEFLEHLLDKEASRLRRQAAQMASPLHRVTQKDDD